MGPASDALQVHSASCTLRPEHSLSRLTKITASPRDGVTEEYVRMIAVNAIPRAMTTREIERASAE